MQQIEQGRQPRLPPPEKPLIVPLPPEMKALGGLTVTVNHFRFKGAKLVDEAKLQQAVAGWLNRPLGFSDLQQAAAAVAEVYRKAGWIVRVYLPEQEINDGLVTLQVVEAVLGKVQVEGAPNLRASRTAAADYVTEAQKPGQPMNAAEIDRGLLLIEDNLGASVQGNLKEGAHDGETDLVLNLENKPRVTGDAGYDNTGPRATGRSRGTASLYGNSLTGRGDQESVNAIYSEGSAYGRGAASLPIGSDGLRVGVNGARLQYRVIPGDFASLDLKGSSSTVGFEVSYPMVRGRSKNLYVNLNQDHKTYDNQSNGAITSDYSVETTTLRLSGDLVDNFGGGGFSTASLGLASGLVNLGASPNEAADRASTDTQGRYFKFIYLLNRLQVITPKASAYAALSGQIANKNLDSSEKFFLGGATGVRAYPANEAGGSDANLVNLELRYRLPRDFSLTGFYDWGRVTVNHDNQFAGAASKNILTLQGAGLGLGWASAFGANFRATWAHRIGSNPNPTLTGMDQDGSRILNRFWVTATYLF